MAVKAEAAANVMFVLCLYSPGPAILETVNSIRQNVSVTNFFLQNFPSWIFEVLSLSAACLWYCI